MNIEHIRSFLEVTATGSFQLAADQLHVTQSTVSARIKALEDRLRQPLFHRKRNGVVLTTGGHQFHSSAINVVRAWERGQQEVSLPEGQKALLSIGIEENHWPLMVSGLSARLADEMPDVATSILADRSDVLMQKLRAGLLDVAVLYDPQHCAEATSELLVQEDLVMYATAPRGVEGGVVPGYVFVDWGDTFRALHSAYFPGVFSHKLTLRQSSVALDHILTAGGSGYFLKRVAEPLVASGRLFVVQDAPVMQRALFVAARTDATNAGLTARAVEAARLTSA
jgi:LysR family transcriptional regulator, flagellar master operon regulator